MCIRDRLGTMLEARKIPDSRKIMEHLSHPKVEKVFELSRSVGAEAPSLKGFVRFKELSGGILYSEIAPKSRALTCLAPHFADRLSTENWMICDKMCIRDSLSGYCREDGSFHRDDQPREPFIKLRQRWL